MVPHQEVVAYEDSLRAAGRDVTAHYYDSDAHVVTAFGDPADVTDATNRAIAFLDEHLK
jgi:dipeptidyl aminopeptidase/acylaminoacyl peptidase